MATIPDLLNAAAHRLPDKAFLRCEGVSYTFAQSQRSAHAIAAMLHWRGLRHGDRVVVQLPNSAEFVLLWMGLAHLGAVMIAIDPKLRPAELDRVLHRARPAAVVAADAPAAERLSDHAAVPLALALPDLLTEGPTPASDHVVRPDDVAVMIGTSGTTSEPKLVMQSHRAFTLAAEAFPWWLGLDENDVLLTAMPLFHINAQVYSTLGALAAGATLVLLKRFSASQFWDQARECGATQFNAVAPLAEMLLAQPERSSDADNPVRLCYLAPPLVPERMRLFERRFGLQTIAGYGMSESPFGTICPLDGSAPEGSMGLLRQHPTLGVINEARVVGPDGVDVAPGGIGELLLRNPSVLRGYFNAPEETAAALRHGWLHTGDLVRRDENGFFFHVGRTKEMIRHLGHNIAPAEIEATLTLHELVDEAAVIGVPSPLGEQDVVAYVVARQQGRDIADELIAHCREHLAPYKVPTLIEFLDTLPRTSTGRVAKHRILRQAIDWQQAETA